MKVSATIISIICLIPLIAYPDYHKSPLKRVRHFEQVHIRNKKDKPVFDMPAKRLATQSPSFFVSEDNLDLHESFSGYNPATETAFSKLTIGDKAIDMIKNARTQIVASVFLFDIMYSKKEPKRDIVKELTDTLVAKKREHPGMNITIVLDPITPAELRWLSWSTRIPRSA